MKSVQQDEEDQGSPSSQLRSPPLDRLLTTSLSDTNLVIKMISSSGGDTVQVSSTKSSSFIPVLNIEDEENKSTHLTYMSYAHPAPRIEQLTAHPSSSADSLIATSQGSEIDSESKNLTMDDTSSIASSMATAELVALRVDIKDADGPLVATSRGSSEDNAIPVIKYGKVDRYGFIVIDEHGQPIRNRLLHEDERKEWKKERDATRAVKWVEMLFVLEKEPDLTKWRFKHRKVKD